MCGIVGYIDFKSKSTENYLFEMNNSMLHRGPDTHGSFFDTYNSIKIALGHRRLSIIELTELGNQPMTYKNYTITFNGEIYNYQELKIQLQKTGHKFISNSDTEVLLQGFEEWGPSMLDKLIGMFAFAIYDSEHKELFLFRDRAGVKPLYYYYHNDVFLFSSELKSFHKHPSFVKELNMDAVSLFFQYGYIPQPHCVFKNANKLESGHYLKINIANRQFEKKCYWNVANCYTMPLFNYSFTEALERTEEILKSAFEYRMVSDVPVGVFLSGGYDSSILTAMLQLSQTNKLNTFTIGFEDSRYNEAKYAKDIATYLGTNHTEYYCTNKEAKEIIPKLSQIYDEPFADSSAIPTILVSQLARKSVTVALSADAGDEIFAGYNKYENALRNLKTLEYLPPNIRNASSKILNRFSVCLNPKNNLRHKIDAASKVIASNNNASLMLKLMSQRLGSSAIEKLFCNYKPNELCTGFDYIFNSDTIDLLSRLQCVDYKTYLVDDILMKVDRATMSVSLEGREPFLDHRIIEFVSRLPVSYKLNGSVKKYLLKEIAYKYIPKELLDRPKKGFAIPISDWFRNDLNEMLICQLDSLEIKNQGIFDTTFINDKMNQYLKGNDQTWEFIWFMYCFQSWYKKWMEN